MLHGPSRLPHLATARRPCSGPAAQAPRSAPAPPSSLRAPVADLDRIGQRPADRLGIGARAVAAHDLHAGMITQPRLDHVSRAAGQDIHALAGLGVDEHGG
jgi:hypothetical protein